MSRETGREHELQQVSGGHCLVGGWTNSFEKYDRQIGSWNPKDRGENSKNIWVATTQLCFHFILPQEILHAAKGSSRVKWMCWILLEIEHSSDMNILLRYCSLELWICKKWCPLSMPFLGPKSLSFDIFWPQTHPTPVCTGKVGVMVGTSWRLYVTNVEMVASRQGWWSDQFE